MNTKKGAGEQGSLQPTYEDVAREISARREAEGLKEKPVNPIEHPVTALPHSAIYKAHRYYARRPHNVFAEIVSHYTEPGDLILDPFCGGGVTVVEALRLRRRVIGIDLNPLATWVTYNEVAPADLAALEEAFAEWYEWCKKQVSPLFTTRCRKCRSKAVAEWYEWSNVLVCPGCGRDIVLAEAEKKSPGVYKCPRKSCGSYVKPDQCERKPDKMVALLVACDQCNERQIARPTPGDLKLYSETERTYKQLVRKERLRIPDDPFPDGNSVRENNLFNKGFYHFRDFFTKRHLIALGRIKKWLESCKTEDEVRQALVHVFSATLRFCNKMVIRSEAWRGDNPLEWAGHIYWPPYTYLEANPLPPLRKRYTALLAAKKEQERDIGCFCRLVSSAHPFKDMSSDATCWLLTQSSHKLPLPDRSVDAIITDPPFGGNVQYAELSDFYLVWVKEFLGLEGVIDTTHEAIETRHHDFEGAKNRDFYENILFKVFKECRRVIKPEGWMVLTFHNRDVGVWMAMNRAAILAGFRLPPPEVSRTRGMVYQDPIKNYTQTIHQKRPGSMLGDFILSFRPVEAPLSLAQLKHELSPSEEKALVAKATQIINYHGGCDMQTLLSGLLPYLSEQGLLAQLTRLEWDSFLQEHFVYRKDTKKWYTKDMVGDDDKLTLGDVIPARDFTREVLFSYLQRQKRASMDDLLKAIYTELVNAERPGMETVHDVISKCCRPVKLKGQKRPVYAWRDRMQVPSVRAKELAAQLGLFEGTASLSHNQIILAIAAVLEDQKVQLHVGATEQRKDAKLKSISVELTATRLGIPSDAFRIVKEIDLLALLGDSVVAAIEVATTLTTIGAAVGRFRNLLAVIPNLSFELAVVVREEHLRQARATINSPANVKDGIAQKITVVPVTAATKAEFARDVAGRL